MNSKLPLSTNAVFLWILLFGLLTETALAQKKFDINGTVKDVSGLPLPGASVLLSGYQMGSVADSDGNFKIAGLGVGKYDILIQMIGYLPAQVSVAISDNSVSVAVVLKDKINQLNEIVVKPDRNRPIYLKQFIEAFLGTSPNAKRCRILNPEVLDFDFDAEKGKLTASTSRFLIVENLALGYRIKFLLKYFEKNDQTNIIGYYGFPHFEELYSSEKRKKAFKTKRQEAFEGSPQHFFAALYQSKIDGSGFIINKLLKVKNTRKMADSIIGKRIDYFGKLASKSSSWSYADSLDYWNAMKGAPDSLEVLNGKPVLTDTLVHSINSEMKSLSFTDALYVVFNKEKESRLYRLFSDYTLPRPEKYKNFQISILHREQKPILFYRNGTIDNPLSAVYEGYWGYEKIADLMPIDYEYKSLN
jgi:hypothetical protein